MERNPNPITPEISKSLRAAVARGRRRLFAKRCVDAIAQVCSAAAAIAAILFALGQFGFDVPASAWFCAAIPFAAGAVWAASCLWRFSDVEIARQIDKSNDLGDRISSSIDFLRQPRPTEWMNVQIASTQRLLQSASDQKRLISKAFPFSAPRRLRECLIAAGLIAAVAAIAPAAYKELSAENGGDFADNPPIAESQTPNLAPAERALLQDRAQKLAEDADPTADPQIAEALRELQDILNDDAAGKLTAEEYEKRLAALKQKIGQIAPQAPSQAEQQAIDEAVRDAVKALAQMKEDPDTQKIAQALENADYDKAADILRDLVGSSDPESKKKLEKLSRMFGDLAKNLDPTDPKLREAIKKNKDLVDALKKNFGNDKMSEEDRKTFESAAKKLQNAENAQKSENAEQNNAESQEKSDADQGASGDSGTQASKASDAIKKLKSALDKQAQSAQTPNEQNAAGDNPQNAQNAGGDNPQNAQNAGGDNAQNEQNAAGNAQNEQNADANADSAEEALRDMARQKQDQQNRSALQDLVDKARKDAENKNAGAKPQDPDALRRQKNVEDFLERAKGKQPQSDDEKNGSEQSQQTGSQQNQQTGSEQNQQTGSEQNQQTGSEQNQQTGSEQSQKSDSEQGQQADSEQGQQADSEQGQQADSEQGQQADSEQGQQAGSEQRQQTGSEQRQQTGSEQGQQAGSEQGQQAGSEQGQQAGSEQGQQAGSEQGQQAGSEQGQQIGSGQSAAAQTQTAQPAAQAGSGHDTQEGPATSADVALRDEKLKGSNGGGESMTTREIIESAGQKGFASQPYRDVFQTYEKAAESVLDNETVPKGYRRYVEKYFDMIRPQQ